MLNMLNFDKLGHIYPYQIIETNLEIVQTTFAINTHRQRLFEDYLSFVEDLKRLQIGSFFLWIDGSFTTQKTYPKDIDLIIFLNIDVFKFKRSRLENLVWQYSKIDGYFAELYPQNHPHSALNDWKKNHWKEVYGSTKEDGIHPVVKKGIIQLNYM
jgi:hypothetical protein